MQLLDCFILPSLRAGLNDPFDKLVEVLMGSNNQTAKTLGEKLRRGEERIQIEPPRYGKLHAV